MFQRRKSADIQPKTRRKSEDNQLTTRKKSADIQSKTRRKSEDNQSTTRKKSEDNQLFSDVINLITYITFNQACKFNQTLLIYRSGNRSVSVGGVFQSGENAS